MMTGRPCLQHSNITWYAIQKKRNESLKHIKEELEEAEEVDEDFKPLALNTDNMEVFILNAKSEKTLKKSLTSTPANDIITETPEKKGEKK